MHLRICPKRLPVKPPCARSTLSWRPSWVSLLAVRWRLSLSSGELIGRAIVAPGRSRAPLGGSTPFWEMAVGAAEVHVDEETGAVVVEEYVPVADIGRSTNPQQCEGQDEGAVMQGLGHTLLEEMVHDGGQLLNANLVDYRVPRAEDLPSRLRCIFVENGDGAGPFGAKGAGEGSLIRRALPRAAAHHRAGVASAPRPAHGLRGRASKERPTEGPTARRSTTTPDAIVTVGKISRGRPPSFLQLWLEFCSATDARGRRRSPRGEHGHACERCVGFRVTLDRQPRLQPDSEAVNKAATLVNPVGATISSHLTAISNRNSSGLFACKWLRAPATNSD
jgi:hypothetical protein